MVKTTVKVSSRTTVITAYSNHPSLTPVHRLLQYKAATVKACVITILPALNRALTRDRRKFNHKNSPCYETK